MVKIFISYRRADSRKDAGRIYDRLVAAFGRDNVFKDVDNIPLGKDFRGILREAVAKCDVQLAIIGRQWVSIKNEDGTRRLDNPGDFVRIEVEAALQRDSCLVIPILVDNASMPQPDDLPLDLRELAFKNGTVVRDDPDFHKDVDKIISALKEEFGANPPPTGKPAAKRSAVYDAHAAIGEFYRVFDAADWESARQILNEMRTSGRTPRLFDIDAHEQEVWDAIEAAARDKEYDVLRLMMKRGNKKRTWQALQTFWQDFPDYDPDDIAEHVHPKKSSAKDILPEPFDWIEIPGGRGTMKASNSGGEIILEIPAETYWMGKYPVTNAQFAKFIEAGGTPIQNGGRKKAGNIAMRKAGHNHAFGMRAILTVQNSLSSV